MISLFTIPKAFHGLTGVIQRNAIESWCHALPGCDVIVLGDDPGVAEAATALGVRHLPRLPRNEFGTPLLDAAFRMAAGAARLPLLVYVNADIILTGGFGAALESIPLLSFLAVGRRTNLDIVASIDFSGDWERRLLERVRNEGKLMHPYGSDVFAFQRDSALTELPPFAVGRPRWDNWFMARPAHLGIPMIDLTPACTVIHQNHGYEHVKRARGEMWEGPEGDRNQSLAGDAYASVLDADYLLTSRGLRRNGRLRRLGLRLAHAVMKRLPAAY